MEPILEIARKLGLTESDLIPYGTDKAKVRLEVLEKFP
ncbi:MAG: formate--tetrahydrofolate ligase, partial [Nitrospina sp.]|nr:formate--tetrahydrofolate ligase [Nitrospina sp.]